MTLNDCIQFTNANPICYLATAENNQPRVRPLGFWFADETGFYFQSGSMKDLYKQLKANSKAEACFYHHENTIGTMWRISGEIEFLEDRSLKEKALKDRPFLKSFGFTPDSPELILFRIAHGKAHFWNWENNLSPKEYIVF